MADNGKINVGLGPMGGYMWQVSGEFGQVICASTQFPDRDTADRALVWLKENIGDLPIES